MARNQETVPKRTKARVDSFGKTAVFYSKDESGEFQATTYEELWEHVRRVGSAFLELGIERGEHVGIVSDNRGEWLVTDLALLAIGAVDVPRGSDAMAGEIAYILNHADCRTAVAENTAQVEKILSHREEIPKLERVIVYDADSPAFEKLKAAGLEPLSYEELYRRGREAYETDPSHFETAFSEGKTDDPATIIYTSGTTGEPKGVILTHRAFLFQMDRVKERIHLDENDIFLSVLPIWHSFERAVEYIIIEFAAAVAYSKPIGKIMLEDMAKIRPTWMTSVPRIWEGIQAAVYRNVKKQSAVKQTLFHFFVGVGQAYTMLSNMFRGLLPQFQRRSLVVDRIVSIPPLILLFPLKRLGDLLVFKSLKEKLGGRFVAGVCGGGALPPYVDNFFQAAGIKLLEGYGLTETAPVLAVRTQDAPVPGTVGSLLPDIEYRVISEEGEEVGPGRRGTLFVRSEQVMEGYYKKPEETAKVLSEDGWLNTGDVAMFTHRGECRILGRTKDTIVLRGGENVEPQPIEDKLVQSEFIDQAMVVGQDQKFLAALIVPNAERMEEFARENNVEYIETEELLEHPEFLERIRLEIDGLINAKSGFKLFEHVYRFRLLSKPFGVGDELTNTMKIKRPVVYKKYHREIEELFRT
ncbi:MAG: AMP-dependent synthetase/ligase [Spirochaetaceae bacterium]